MIALVCFIAVLLSIVGLGSPEEFRWVSAVAQWSASEAATLGPHYTDVVGDGTQYYNYWVNFTANSNIVSSSGEGHFRVNVTTSFGAAYAGQSRCFAMGESKLALVHEMERIVLAPASGIGTSTTFKDREVAVDAMTGGLGYASGSYVKQYKFSFEDKVSLTAPITVAISYHGCEDLVTVGDWEDAARWDSDGGGGGLPTAADDVVISAGGGVILLPSSEDIYTTEVQSLDMSGGELIGHRTSCPPGWSITPNSYPGQRKVGRKCFRLFTNSTTYGEAEQTCRDQGYGAMGAHLMQLESYEEAMLTKDICRGDGLGGPVDSAGSLGCWIGLRDLRGTGQFAWEDATSMIDRSQGYKQARRLPLNTPQVVNFQRALEVHAGSAIGSAFRDWRRGGDEPNNRTVSNGEAVEGGERCVYMVPHQNNPYSFEEGSFSDISCGMKKPFVCQVLANTRRHELHVTGEVTVTGGGMAGGTLRTTGRANIVDMFISSSATLHLDTATSALAQSTIDALAMGDGSSLEVGGSLRVSRSGGVIGEGDERHGLVPIIRLAESAEVEVDGQDIQWNARVEAKKDSKVSLLNAGTSLAMNRGGSLELSELSLAGADTEVRLGAGAMSLNTWDSFDVYVAHRAEVSGEYPEFSDYATDVAAIDGASSADANGVFKLVVTRDGTDQITRCIPYHATEETMKMLLDELSHVQARGNVTVRRSGKGHDPAFRFGYKWRLDFDSTVTAEYDKAMDLQLHCQGSFDGCGCSWPTVDTRDPTGQLTCPTFIQGSKTDPSKCAMQSTDLRVERLTYLSQLTTTEGDLGRVVVQEGAHRMPPVSKVLVAASGGVSMLQGDSIVWKGLEAASDAVVKVYGISWLGYDSAIVLYMPGWAQTRNFAQLQLAPSFNMAVEELQCTNMSHLLFVTPNSQFTVDTAVWGGGVIGGRAQVTVMDLMLMNDNNKALRDDVTLFIHQQATLRWVGGNVSVSNGADVHIEGIMTAESTNAVAPYFGQAQLMSAPDNSDGLSLLESEPPRMWDGYFDARVPRALRDGWFDTPICGTECRSTSEVLIRSNGIVNVVESANVVFSVQMNFVDDSRFNMRAQCSSNLESGGRFGNDVVVNMQEGSTVSLTGGRMFMGETCQITGEGDLIVLEGYHDVASLIAAKITIQGGTLAWPISRGDGRSIVFENGLTIEKIGRLEVQPWSTIIEVKKEVIFKDDCVLQFPMIGIASQPLMSDRQAGITLNASTTLRDRLDAPDPAPSGRLIARDKLTFLGGTMRGKAKFESFGVMLLDGAEKRVRSLAKLINRGVAIWGDGDILTADQGDFLNFGTLQTNSSEPGFKRGVFYEGTVIPTENGGDRYALLFHTWDVDEGQLDMAQYIAERKNYVSRAPPGWTAEWQNGLYIAGQDGYDRTDGSGSDRPISDTYEESIPLIEMNAYYDRRVYGRRLDAGGFVRHQEVEDHLLWAS